MKVKDEDGITVVNHAKTQLTYADYILAEEEYARKKALVAEAKRAGTQTKTTTASSIAARLDREENVRQIKRLLADATLRPEERNSLERKLEDEEMAHAFAPRQ